LTYVTGASGPVGAVACARPDCLERPATLIPSFSDQRAIALDVGIPQIVQQTPLLAHQEKEAAARVMVLGVRLQVLGELPNAGGRKRNLDLGEPVSSQRVCTPRSACL